MSYDIYCYKSNKSTPDFEEAPTSTDLDNDTSTDESEKNVLVDRLIKLDPTLQRFDLDHGAIARSQNLTLDEAKRKFNYIELNSPEGELQFQIGIANSSLTITTPYWYDDEKIVHGLFLKMQGYLQTIFDSVGWHGFDPQTGQVFTGHDFDLQKAERMYLKTVHATHPQEDGQKKISSNRREVAIIIAILAGIALLRAILFTR